MLLIFLFKLQVMIIFTLTKLKLHKDRVVIRAKYNLPFYLYFLLFYAFQYILLAIN